MAPSPATRPPPNFAAGRRAEDGGAVHLPSLDRRNGLPRANDGPARKHGAGGAAATSSPQSRLDLFSTKDGKVGALSQVRSPGGATVARRDGPPTAPGQRAHCCSDKREQGQMLGLPRRAPTRIGAAVRRFVILHRSEPGAYLRRGVQPAGRPGTVDSVSRKCGLPGNASPAAMKDTGRDLAPQTLHKRSTRQRTRAVPLYRSKRNSCVRSEH